MFSALAIAASGLSAQRVRMDVVAQNLANAETTKTPEGGPYRRRVVTLEAVTPESSFSSTIDASAAGAGGIAGSTPIEMTNDVGGVRVASITEDKTEGPQVYDPGNPSADAHGYVRLPNVSMTDEMMDLMDARRVYEANATVFQVARAMLHQAVSI